MYFLLRSWSLNMDEEKTARHGERSARIRVRKGPYKQYLRTSDPFQSAPKVFKRQESESNRNQEGTNSMCIPETIQEEDDVSFTNAGSSNFMENDIMEQTEGSTDEQENHDTVAASDHAEDENTILTAKFIQDTVCQNKLVNESTVENDSHCAELTEEVEYNFEQCPFSAYETSLENEVLFCEGESSDSDTRQDEANENVHSNTTLTLGASMLLIMSFTLKYSLTGEGLCDLLSLIDLHCPDANRIPKSLGQFRKWFEDIKNPLVFHKYCSYCHMYVGKNEDRVQVCLNEKCQKTLAEDSISHFIEIPIKKQIQTFISRPTFLTDISHRFNRNKEHAESIEDIYDGKVYKKLSGKGEILDNPLNISLLWNTDGVPCFKSSKMSLWPLFFQINELPYNKRSDPENIILGGLWFGSSKPTIMCFTEPFLKNLQDLEENGIEISTGEENGHKMKVILIAGTADMPARSLLCNTVQFNGKYGCCKCLQPGETLKTGPRGHVHVFPFQTNTPDGPSRTHEEMIRDTFSAIETGKPCNGVKGPNFLMCLKYYDLAEGTCIDYMHGVLLGVTKLLLTLWFSAEHSSEFFSLSDFVEVVDGRLKMIKPPNSIKRAPRSIKEHLKYWKPSELRSWLLYYSAPILRDIQQMEYFKHYMLFVHAVFILLQNSITIEDLKKAEEFLLHFVCTFCVFYKDRYMTCNIHQLIHLPRMVYEMGPLWAYSCFPFENCNGTLLQLYHGTQHVDEQIAHTVSLMQRLPELQYQHLNNGSPAYDLYQSLKGVHVQKSNKLLEDNIYVVGAAKQTKLQQEHQDVLSSFLGQLPSEYVTFNRIRVGNETFHSKNYQRCSVRNSFTVAYKHEDGIVPVCIGQVEYYMQLRHCKVHKCVTSDCFCSPLHVAVVSHLKPVDNPGEISKLKHVLVVHRTCDRNVLHIVPVGNILYKCVFVEVHDSPYSYACKMPNYFEKA